MRDLVPVQTVAGKGALFDRASGRVFENVMTTDFTKGAVCARPAWVVASSVTLSGSASAGQQNLFEITLTENTAWSALAGRLAVAATIDLNGFELLIDDFASFTAKGVRFAETAGSIRVPVPSNETVTFISTDGHMLAGHLVKEGAGTLVLSASSVLYAPAERLSPAKRKKEEIFTRQKRFFRAYCVRALRRV